MNKEIGLQILENIIAFNKYESSHEAHEIAEFCQMVAYGKNEEEAVKALRPHETDAQKQQRARLYHSLSQYAANKILNYIRRLKSVEDVTINYQDLSDEQKKTLDDSIKDFYDEKTLLEYLIEFYAVGQAKDPNGVILLNSKDVADDLGVLITRKIEPSFIPSSKIIEIQESQGVIKYGITKEIRTVQYDESQSLRAKMVQKPIVDLYFYADDLTMILIADTSELKSAMEIDMPPIELNNQPFELLRVKKEDGTTELYRVYTYERIGFPCPLVALSGRKSKQHEDLKTSILTLAEPQFKELISRVSELNVTISCHVFPQKFAIVPKCNYVDSNSNSCEGGSCGGKLCPSCKGTGGKYHISSQDIVTIVMEHGSTQADMPDLSKMVYFAQHDDFAAKFLETQIIAVLTRLSDAVFETNIFAAATVNASTSSKSASATPQNGVAETATKTAIDWQKLYMSLKQDAEHIEKMFSLTAKYQSVLLFGANKAKIKLNFPKDFKFMTLDELIDEYNKATAAGLPYDVIEKILIKIIEKQNPDDAETLAWVKMKQKHKPFSDKTAQEVAVIIQSRAFDDFDRALWENFDAVMDELQEEKPQMIGMTYMEQKALLKEKVAAFVADIKEAQGNDLNTLFNTVGN